MFANHGSLKKHAHEIEGINSRMDGIQAALLTAKLDHIESWTAERQRVAAAYNELLTGVGDLELPAVRDGATHVYHLYVVKTAHRDALKAFLAEQDVQTGIHYPAALPVLPAYDYLGVDASSFPNAVTNQDRILSLPIYPELSQSMIEYVASQIERFFSEQATS